MDEIIFRKATIKDVSFLVETIIEAEKAGTQILPYATIFDLSEMEVRKYLKEMLMEEIKGCGELSISSYLLAEKENKVMAAASAWLEGEENVPTAILKGNLLNFILPKKSIEKAIKLQKILHELNFDYKANVIHMGAGYVAKEYRGNNLLMMIKERLLSNLTKENPDVTEAYVDTFSCSKGALRGSEKLGFYLVESKQSSNDDILIYLPSNKKLFLKKELK